MIWVTGIAVFVIGIILSYILLPSILDFVIEKSQTRGFFNGPWKTHLGVGLTTTPKVEKAGIARIGLGGNSAEETIYWNVFTDSDGQPLTTDHTYEIIIKKAIPVDYSNFGFWSITAYGEDQFLMQNPLNQFMIRCANAEMEQLPMTIVLSNDLSLHDSKYFIPLSERKQKFTMALRCYRPLSEMQKYETCRSIQLPLIKRIT